MFLLDLTHGHRKGNAGGERGKSYFHSTQFFRWLRSQQGGEMREGGTRLRSQQREFVNSSLYLEYNRRHPSINLCTQDTTRRGTHNYNSHEHTQDTTWATHQSFTAPRTQHGSYTEYQTHTHQPTTTEDPLLAHIKPKKWKEASQTRPDFYEIPQGALWDWRLLAESVNMIRYIAYRKYCMAVGCIITVYIF